MDSLEVMRDSVLVEVMVGVRVEVDAITSVLNSQKNSGAAEDVDDKVVVGSWVSFVSENIFLLTQVMHTTNRTTPKITHGITIAT